MELSPTALVLIGVLLAAWTLAAAWVALWAHGKARRAQGSRRSARRMARMIEEAPAIPMLVRTDGRIEASDKLATWLGLDRMPQFLSELDGGSGKGLSESQVRELSDHVRTTQRTAAPFRMVATQPGAQRSFAFRGVLADPQVSPGGAALVWVFDFSESETELARSRAEARRARSDFAALVGLIEAAPIPMWFREPDGTLQLVNRAYVTAVGAGSAEAVVAGQVELVEEVDGLTAAQVAQQAAAQNLPVERIVSATIDGQRRTLRVSDLPLGSEGVAGYAVDIEEMEELARTFRAFRDAQRQMLDQLSVGVAQFDAQRRIVFANQPFRRIFALAPGTLGAKQEFERILTDAREAGRIPEVRDFPAWRREHVAWFASGEPQEEAWPLPDGTHIRVVAQPMPDGGLVLVAEDRTEQLALSSTRDTLLRTRTATFDNLFEALAVFAPDGRLQLWNRTFAGIWGLDAALLDNHPTAESLLGALASNLNEPGKARSIGETIRAATLDRKQRGGRVALADGRTLEFAGVPLPDGNGLLTVLDVTANEQAESALRERNLALEQADQVKTRFLANMSYEFRTPLTSIGGFAELLQAGVAGELSDQGRDYVEAIIDSVGRLTAQVENVLDLSQSEAGLLPLSKVRVELFALATQVVREREKAVVAGGLHLDLRGSKASGTIEADPRQIAKALGHVLDNAIVATPVGGKILIDLSKSQGLARIVISDNGRGMSSDELRRLQQGGAIDGGRKQGLGIPLARQLVEAHGGTLEIVSRQGEGTTVTMVLP